MLMLIKRLKTLITGKPYFNVRPDIRIEQAFISGGEIYYKNADPNNLLCGRAFAASNYYNELSMKCTREFLLQHTQAVDKILKSNKIDVFKINTLNNQLQERLELVSELDIVYRLAAVMYFDSSEDPYSFDYSYAEKKIAKWKKEDVKSFFLQTPVSSLIPSSLLSEEALENYLKVGQAITAEHLETISEILSPKQNGKEKYT